MAKNVITVTCLLYDKVIKEYVAEDVEGLQFVKERNMATRFNIFDAVSGQNLSDNFALADVQRIVS